MVDIIIEDYDESKYIMYIRKRDINIWMIMSIMSFDDEMEYFGMPLEQVALNGEIGYVFDKAIDRELVYQETNRFVLQYKVDEKEIF